MPNILNIYRKHTLTVIGDLIFFDKEGYALNFAYNKQEELYEGKLLFDENSNLDVIPSSALLIYN